MQLKTEAHAEAQNAAHKEDHLLALLDVGRTPVSLTLKPDGGEMIVCNFDSDSISIIETGNDEVGSSLEIGEQPSRAVVTLDNSRLYVTNFGSNSVAVYDIDMGRRIATLTVGSRPDGLALTPDQNYLLVLDTQSGDVTVIQKRQPRKLEPTEYSLLTLIPVGMQPNAIVVKAFMQQEEVKSNIDGRGRRDAIFTPLSPRSFTIAPEQASRKDGRTPP